jgi:hypothetical protein
MGQIHNMIELHGIDGAKKRVVSKAERAHVETAHMVLSEEHERLGFTHAGFALTSLPHKTTPELFWRREGHNVTLLVESGRDSHGNPIGVPYGPMARFIVLYLQTEAIKTNSQEVELGGSMRSWLNRMGLSVGGQTYKGVLEQARRISACHLTFIADKGGVEIRRNGGFVDTSISMIDVLGGDQPSLWTPSVKLNGEFYRSLKQHPVPISETALRAIGPRSAVIDVYLWLAYRLHHLDGDVSIRWPALQAQFGYGYGRMVDFRRKFQEILAHALAAYPDARVSIDESGVVLHPSRPPIALAGV